MRGTIAGRASRVVVTVLAVALGGGMPGVAVAQGELYVTNGTRVTVHARTASGDAAPLRVISGAATGVNNPKGIALDATNGEIVFSNSNSGGSVTTHQRLATGNVTPRRLLAGSATGLAAPEGMAVDLVHDELVVVNSSGTGDSITVYSRTAGVNSAPLRTITGGATGISCPQGVAVDPANDEIFLANFCTGTVTVYSGTANGNVAPVRTLSGAATLLNGPEGIAVDAANGEILVTTFFSNSVLVFARTASGNTAPLRAIVGGATGLNRPSGVAVSPEHGEIYVANAQGNTITVYGRTDNGNVPPLRTVGGAASLVSGPRYIAVSPGDPPPSSTLVAAVLPSSRSVTVGTPATAFVTIINAAGPTAENVAPSLGLPVPAVFGYQTTDPATNATTGSPNTPVSIPPGGKQTYVVSVTPTAAFAPTELALSFAGANAPSVPTLVGINTLLLSASTSPVPDTVMLAATIFNDGIANIPGPGGTGIFSVAMVNVGASALMTISADDGGAGMAASITLCQTNPITGQCISAIAPSVTFQVDEGATPTVGVFVAGQGIVPFDPSRNRAFVRAKDQGGVVRGSTSVAVRTQ